MALERAPLLAITCAHYNAPLCFTCLQFSRVIVPGGVMENMLCVGLRVSKLLKSENHVNDLSLVVKEIELCVNLLLEDCIGGFDLAEINSFVGVVVEVRGYCDHLAISPSRLIKSLQGSFPF
ncbi:hypothetical protein EZV62_015814 [Acer yangbiense]|uniref:Uncharacterized protein n=1 Tax=Acer yangbiense TaxID=1000413 RepID=A0A5C7HMN8_9ROSI|nr:hypothetical protein EZV62_015814 [Acer yangbiense]